MNSSRDLPPSYSEALLSPRQPEPRQDAYEDQHQQQQLQPEQQQNALKITNHVIFALVVFCTGNLLFGLIAFVLAVAARRKASSDPTRAKRLADASLGVSVAGIILSCVALINAEIVNVVLSSASDDDACSFTHDGLCYRYRSNVGSYGHCAAGVRSGFFCYSNSTNGTTCPYHSYDGRCYRYISDVGTFGKCIGVKSTANSDCYHDGSCKYFQRSCYAFETIVGTYGYCIDGAKSGYYCYTDTDPASPCPYYTFDGRCYQYRNHVKTGLCIGVVSPRTGDCYHDGRCKYFNGSCYKYESPANNYSYCNGPKSTHSSFCYSNDECPYFVDNNGVCYMYRADLSSSGICIGVKFSTYCYHNGSCRYAFNGSCYKSRNAVGDYTYCSGVRSGGACYSSDGSSSCLYHVLDGQCYRYKQYVGLLGNCFGVKPFLGTECYHNGSCLYAGNSCYRYKTNATVYSRCIGVKENGFCFTDTRNCPYATYMYLGACYRYRLHVGLAGQCQGVKVAPYCYTDDNASGYPFDVRTHSSSTRSCQQCSHLFALQTTLLLVPAVTKFWQFTCLV